MRDAVEGEGKREESLRIIARQREEIASMERLLERKTMLVRMMVHDRKGPLSGMTNLDLPAAYRGGDV